ncbi:hypothetical protein OJAV_G00119790 [Oryzias javanicus]|uniref:Uncharacterized protein n=1 Tax=Oryzias javanicus TaxID=123683 RepID=A0A3S2PNN1_ORYJA|nr:hypothetical protein OJAV_G00119790 [Oryzias javanicus]
MKENTASVLPPDSSSECVDVWSASAYFPLLTSTRKLGSVHTCGSRSSNPKQDALLSLTGKAGIRWMA